MGNYMKDTAIVYIYRLYKLSDSLSLKSSDSSTAYIYRLFKLADGLSLKSSDSSP
jgi:hypothetical protein